MGKPGHKDWRTRRWRDGHGTCIEPGCSSERFPGLTHCYEHASKDAMACLVEEAVRHGFKPGLLRVRS